MVGGVHDVRKGPERVVTCGSVSSETNPLFAGLASLEYEGEEGSCVHEDGGSLLSGPREQEKRLSIATSIPVSFDGKASLPPPMTFSWQRNVLFCVTGCGAFASTVLRQAFELGVSAVPQAVAEASLLLMVLFVTALCPLLLWGALPLCELRRAVTSYVFVATNAFLVANLVVPWAVRGRFPIHAALLVAATNAAVLNLFSLCSSRRLAFPVLALALLSFAADVARDTLFGEDSVILSAGGVALTLHSVRRSALLSVATTLALALANSVRGHNGGPTNPFLPVAAMQWEVLAGGVAGLPPYFLTRVRAALTERRRAASLLWLGAPTSPQRCCWRGPQWMAPQLDAGAQPTRERARAAWRVLEDAAAASYADVAEQQWSKPARVRHRFAVAMASMALLVYVASIPQAPCISLALVPLLALCGIVAVALLFWRNVTQDTVRRALLSPGALTSGMWILLLEAGVAAGALSRPEDGGPLPITTCDGAYRLASSTVLVVVTAFAALQAALVTRSPRLEAAISATGFFSQLLNIVLFTVSVEFAGPSVDLIKLPRGHAITYTDALRSTSLQVCIIFARLAALALREAKRHSDNRARLHISRTFVNSALEVAPPRFNMLDAYAVELADEFRARAGSKRVELLGAVGERPNSTS